jgi:hypothetical protein
MSHEESTLPPKPSNNDLPTVLPRVEPPSVTFLLQLFLIPLLIVSAIIAVWLLFSWLATAGSDPRDMLKEIRSGRGMGWQQAVSLANALEHSHERYADLRKDATFAKEIGEIVREELKTPLSDATRDAAKLKVRYYLCRILGQMETGAAVPPLLEAAALDRNPVEIEIRLGALESLAVLAKRLPFEEFSANGEAVKVLIACSKVADAATPPPVANPNEPNAKRNPQGELRGTAAFALGILGTPDSLERLAEMTHDLYPSARYNAATGLARAGDIRCKEVVLEMLDPKNEASMQNIETAAERAAGQFQVIKNGITSVEIFAKASAKSTDLAPFIQALEFLTKLKQLEEGEEKLKLIEEPTARDGLQRKAQELLNALKANERTGSKVS